MRKRRTRYTFTATKYGREGNIDVLAYSLDGAIHVLTTRGYTDVRRTTKPPASKAGAAWAPDWAAINHAIEFLGLTLPVDIKLTGHQGGRYGAHTFRAARGAFYKDFTRDTASGGMRHAITVKNWLAPEQAGRTLWHELCHAMQAENAVKAAGAVTMREQLTAWAHCSARRGNYSYRPIEVEAREYEAFNDEQPLARAL